MGKIVRCPECRETYRALDRLEDLRDNDSVCLVCNSPIDVADWDRVLASYTEPDFDDVDDEDDFDDAWDPDDDGLDDDYDDADLERDDVDNYG